MNKQDLHKLLQIVTEKVVNEGIKWCLDGSANLSVQGIDVTVNDLDISTDDAGVLIFKKVLSEYVVKDGMNEKINSYRLVCDVDGFEVEINSYRNEEKRFFDKVSEKSWDGITVPVLPLEYAKKFYEFIGRDEKVKLIEVFLSS